MLRPPALFTLLPDSVAPRKEGAGGGLVKNRPWLFKELSFALSASNYTILYVTHFLAHSLPSLAFPVLPLFLVSFQRLFICASLAPRLPSLPYFTTSAGSFQWNIFLELELRGGGVIEELL